MQLSQKVHQLSQILQKDVNSWYNYHETKDLQKRGGNIVDGKTINESEFLQKQIAGIPA